MGLYGIVKNVFMQACTAEDEDVYNGI